MSLIVKIGDTTLITFTLLKDGSSFNITATSTVKVRFYEGDTLNSEIGTVTATNTETGADWSNSVVTVKLAKTVTALLTNNARLEPRVSITDDSEETITYTGENLPKLTVREGF